MENNAIVSHLSDLLTPLIFQQGEILYNNTNTEQIETLEAIETTVRKQTLKYISPKIALFLSKNRPEVIKEENEKSKVVLES